MKTLQTTVAAALSLTIAACGVSRDAGRTSMPDGTSAAGSVVLLLDVPPRARAGEEVAIAATLVNRGDETQRVPAAGPDIVVTRVDGAEVWRRSRHSGATGGASAALNPREMRGSGYTWDQRDDAGRPVSPGTYRVRATIPSGPGEAASAWKTLVIVPAP